MFNTRTWKWPCSSILVANFKYFGVVALLFYPLMDNKDGVSMNT